MVYDGVLLHVLEKDHVHAELKKFPDHTDGHGKAESDQGQIGGGQAEMGPVVPVQDIYQGKTHGGAEKAPDGVHDGVPVGIAHIVAAQLAQNLGGKDMQHDDDLQARGKFYAEVLLDKSGDKKEDQYQQAYEHAVVISAQDGQHHDGNDQQTQYSPYHKGLPVVPDDRFEVAYMVVSFLSHAIFSFTPFYLCESRFPVKKTLQVLPVVCSR